MKTRLLFLMLFFGIIATSQAQVSISTEGTDPHESAMLDVTSTDKGLLIPRMSSAERSAIINPANGLMVFDLSTDTFWFYSGATNQWEEMGGAIVNVLNDLLDAKTDANSIYIGSGTALDDDGDNFNVALGQNSMKENISGSHNAAAGYGALENNTSGENNVAFGDNTLNNTSNGHKNTAIGKGAGQNTANNSSSNIFIGYNAGKDEQGSNKLYIENTESPTPLIGGDFDADEVIINGDLDITNGLTVLEDVNAQANLNVSSNLNVGMNATINNNLNVAENITTDALKITGGTPATGKVLTSDNNGNATWQNALSGVEELNDLSDAKTIGTSVMIGSAAGTYITGNNNVSLGFASLFKHENSFNNVAIGYAAGYTNNPTSVSGNIYIGAESGTGNTENDQLFIDNSGTETPLIHGDFAADHLTFNGTVAITGGNPEAGKVLTTDDDGIASWEASNGAEELNDLNDASSSVNSLYLGLNSGQNQVNDNYNTAVGQYSLMNSNNGFSNTAIGNNAMNSSTVGNNNTAIGISALQFNTNGNQNTTVGSYSLYNNMGNYNTAIGYQAGQGAAAYNTMGNILIGYQAGYYETENGKLYIENTSSSTPLIGGDFNTDEVVINGTLAITGGNPAEGKVMVSDADGKASWEDVAGAQDLNGLNDAKTTGSSVFIGENTGQNANAPQKNTAIGHNSYVNSANGLYNTVLGAESMVYNTDGSDNVANGYNSLRNNTTGTNNIAIGSYALWSKQTGDNNVVIGSNAGRTAPDISGSIMIGYQAGYGETEDNKLYIENSNSSTPLIGGDFSTDEVIINGTLEITGGNPGDGKVLVSDATGKASWQNAAGAQNIDGLSDAKNDNSSIFLGSLGALDSGNNKNTAVGNSALTNNEIGTSNSAFGHNSLLYNNSGTKNSAFGESSMELNTNGANNTAIGSGALYYNGSGTSNTALGFEAGFGNASSTSSGNVFLGNKAGYYETGSNKLYIDNSDTYFPLVYGDFSQNKLEVNGEFKVASGSYSNLVVNDTKLEANVNIEANANVDIAGELNVEGVSTLNADLNANGEINANEKIIANKTIEAHDDIILSDDKNITYENVRTGKLQLSGLEFIASSYEEDELIDMSYSGSTLMILGSNYNSVHHETSTQIKLPEGAKITNITLNFLGTVNNTLDISVIKRTPAQAHAEGEVLFQSDFTFGATQWTTYSFGFSTNPIIDHDFIYYLQLEGQIFSDDYLGGLFGLTTATIEYEYSTLNY